MNSSFFKEKKFVLILLCFSIILLTIAGIVYWQKSRFDPSKYEGHISAATQAYDNSEYSVALDNYIKAMEAAPRKVDGYVGSVTVLVEKGRYDDAMNIISQVENNLESESKAKLWIIAGDGYAADELFDEALEAYEEAYGLHGTSGQAEAIVMSAMKSGNLETVSSYINDLDDSSEVKETWSSYRELKSDEADLYDVVKASQDLINEGYYHLAIDLLEAREEDMSEYWEGRYFLGRAYYEVGEFDKALSQMESASSLGADDSDLFWYLGRINIAKSKNSSAFNYYDRAVQFSEDEDVQPIVDEYLEELIENEQYSKAEDLLNIFFDKNFAQVGFVKLYFAESKYDQLLEASGRYDPGSEGNERNLVDYYSTMINYYLNEDKLEDAKEMAELLGEIDGQEAFFAYYLGLIYKEEGNLEEAKVQLERSIDLDLQGKVTELAKKELAGLQ